MCIWGDLTNKHRCPGIFVLHFSSLSEGRWFPQGRLFFFFFDSAGADFYSFITELSVQHRRGQHLKGVGGACLFCRWQPATPTDKFKSAHFCTAAALLFAPSKTTILYLVLHTLLYWCETLESQTVRNKIHSKHLCAIDRSQISLIFLFQWRQFGEIECAS